MSRPSRSTRPSAKSGRRRVTSDRASAERQSRSRAMRERTPYFGELDHSVCEDILARNSLGRLVYSLHDRLDVEPLNYVYDDGWIYGRTSPGTKLQVLQHRPWVAFEVDEVDGMFDWRSVVARGTFYTLDPEGPAREAAAYRRAIRLLRRLIPETGTAADPVPFRNVVFRIHVDELSGRWAIEARAPQGA